VIIDALFTIHGDLALRVIRLFKKILWRVLQSTSDEASFDKGWMHRDIAENGNVCLVALVEILLS